jgi:hypothetical protein
VPIGPTLSMPISGVKQRPPWQPLAAIGGAIRGVIDYLGSVAAKALSTAKALASPGKGDNPREGTKWVGGWLE